MFFGLLSYIVPIAVSAALTCRAFSHYYSPTEPRFLLLCLISAVAALLFSLPCRRVCRPLFGLMGVLFVINLTHNLFVMLIVLPLSFIVAWLTKAPCGRQRLLFTPDNKLIRISYAPQSSAKVRFARMSAIAFVLSFILAILSIYCSTPVSIWGIRAFPIDLTEREVFAREAVPSGRVTCASLYDSSAIVIDSFFSVTTDHGTIPSPAESAGMKKGDVVIKINGERAKQSGFIKNGSDGSEALFEILRFYNPTKEPEVIHLKITPVYSSEYGKHVIGINYYDSVLPGIYQSIQTVSFSYPDTGYFAATAHSSEISPDEDYITVLKTAENIGRDESGLTATAGETLGKILYSSRYGSFGKWTHTDGYAIPIAKKSELRLGRATLLSSFETGEVKEYDIYITGTYRIDHRDVICLVATDEAIHAAGGITRGMSGSPIIQQGKIIGALSNTDSGGYYAFATFASDMAHELYISQDVLSTDKEATV